MTDTLVHRPRGPQVPPEITRKLLTHLREGTTDLCPELMRLEPRIFSDPAVAGLERRRIFGRVPFIAAHGSEVPEPHSFLTKKLPLNEAVIVRQADGSVRTFVNMCRHRGTMLSNEEKGHCRIFSCQYHGWSYDLDGTLRNITYPESFGPVDRSQLNLIELPTEERHGFIWVVDNPDATIDVAKWLGPETDAILASYGMDELVCFRAGAFVEPVNWKVMHDAFLDGYHIKFAHPRSAGKYVHTNTYVVEDFGRHCRFASPRKSLDAWLEQDPLDDESMVEHVMLSHFLGPNVTLLQLQDNYQLLSFYPISDNPAESRMEMRLMVPPLDATDLDPDEWQVKWEKNWYILEKVLLGEDFPLLRSIQRAYASEVSTPSILGRNEVLNQTFHREVARMRDDEPVEIRSTAAG